MTRDSILFSIIIPSSGRRPQALRQAVQSVERAGRFAGLETKQLEILIGFDGIKGRRPKSAYPLQCFNLPSDKNQGNGIRRTLVRVARGDKLIFLDDDNVLKPYALRSFLRYFDTELIVGRIDMQLALKQPYLPIMDDCPIFRNGNVDLLNLCVSRRLVLDRCGGWQADDGVKAVWKNINLWQQQAHSVTSIEEIVGVYDAGRSLDRRALSPRQMALLDGLIEKHGAQPLVKGNSIAMLGAH